MAKYPMVHGVKVAFMQLPRDFVYAYVVELPKSVVVIDSGVSVSGGRRVREVADSFGKPIEAVLLTHGHPDHYVGLVNFADVPKFATPGCLEFAHVEDVRKAPVATHYMGPDFPPTRVFPDQMIADGTALTFGGVTFKFVDFGPAESDSDGMWVFEKDGVRHLFVGDLVANQCHNFVRDGHVPEWLKVLDRLEQECAPDSLLFIGHGESPVHRAMIDWQRGYLKSYLDAVATVTDRSIPASRPIQESVIARVREYLPGEATLFLLDYEMDETLDGMFKLHPTVQLARKARVGH